MMVKLSLFVGLLVLLYVQVRLIIKRWIDSQSSVELSKLKEKERDFSNSILKKKKEIEDAKRVYDDSKRNLGRTDSDS